jgi:hypothetical protein
VWDQEALMMVLSLRVLFFLTFLCYMAVLMDSTTRPARHVLTALGQHSADRNYVRFHLGLT